MLKLITHRKTIIILPGQIKQVSHGHSRQIKPMAKLLVLKLDTSVHNLTEDINKQKLFMMKMIRLKLLQDHGVNNNHTLMKIKNLIMTFKAVHLRVN